MNIATAHSMTESPQERLAAILDSHQPTSILTVSLNPIPVVAQWCKDHNCTLVEIQEQNPFPALDDINRVDIAIVADQLEYMPQHDGEALMGLLRNLHTDSMVAVYQPTLAPQKFRLPANGLLALGRREPGHFAEDGRGLNIYRYDLTNYNFERQRTHHPSRANPENCANYR